MVDSGLLCTAAIFVPIVYVEVQGAGGWARVLNHTLHQCSTLLCTQHGYSRDAWAQLWCA